MDRNRARLRGARRGGDVCAISGAVGTFANIDPRSRPMSRADGPDARAGLDPGDPARPPRGVLRALAVVASSIERLATEIRHLQRTEVLEAEEFFSPGQKGSSAMPHKRNPVLTENLTGLARLVRAYACRRWRTWRSGMSATSRTRRSSG
jgi:adenylosuccinate lyase